MRMNGYGAVTGDRKIVLVRRSGAADAGGSSVAHDPRGGECGAGGVGPDLKASYSRIGRPSIALEKLLRALLLQVFGGIRLERQMMERLDFVPGLCLGRLCRFAGLSGWAWTSECGMPKRSRRTASACGIAARFLSSILALPRVRPLLPSDHFSFDGTPATPPASRSARMARNGRTRPRETWLFWTASPSIKPGANIGGPDRRVHRLTAENGRGAVLVNHSLRSLADLW